MPDLGHEMTEDMLQGLETRIAAEYSTALADMERKLADYMQQFEDGRQKQRALLDAGKITQQDYDDWVYRHTMVGNRWEQMRDTLAKDLERVTDKALEMSRGIQPDVFALNADFASWQIEHDGRIDAGFTLYNRDTAEYLLSEQRQLMPGPSSRKAKEIAAHKWMQWDKQKIQSAVLQGVLQGESPFQVAERLRQVAQMKYNASVRYARTMTTSAQNAGRYEAYRRAKRLGVDLTIEWAAILDSRTRHDHRQMHGQRKNVDEPFITPEGFKIFYPADSSGASDAPQKEIWNCRCTLLSWVKGFEGDTVKSSPGMGDKSFEEWRNEKAPKQNVNPQLTQTSKKRVTVKDSEVSRLADSRGVDYLEVQYAERQLDEGEIITTLSGGDKTSGSCASLGLAYCGQKQGIDVLDFRGGKSVDLFSKDSTLAKLKNIPGIAWHEKHGNYYCTTGNQLLKEVEEGKEYWFACGRHAAVVTRKDGKLKYLELQSAYHSGWQSFNGNARYTLAHRFGAPSSRYYDATSFMFEVDSVKDSPEFAKILGYINTEPSKQMKGISGTIK